MSRLTLELKTNIQQAPKKPLHGFDPVRYMGTSHPYLGLATKTKENIAKSFFQNHKELSFEDLTNIITELMHESSFEEKTVGPFLLNCYKHYNSLITPNHLEKWLLYLEGWCEIDTLCQNRLEEQTILHNWDLWEKGLKKFAHHNNINHRRASLVLLCKPIRKTTDKRIYILAINNIELLKHEKDILITKAISWVLRESTKKFKEDVSDYLKNNSNSLPAIAVRETKRKLATGKK